VHLLSAISDLSDVLVELASAEKAGATEGTIAGADGPGSDPFETASDGLDNKDLGTSNSMASPAHGQGPPRLEAVDARVCTRHVEKGLLRTKPTFVRTNCEAKICTLVGKAGLEGVCSCTSVRDRVL